MLLISKPVRVPGHDDFRGRGVTSTNALMGSIKGIIVIMVARSTCHYSINPMLDLHVLDLHY